MKEKHIAPRPEVIPPSVRFEAMAEAPIIQVTVEGGDPREITTLANTIVQRYADVSKSKSTEGITRTKEFVVQELKRQESKLAEAEKKLAQFREVNNIAQRFSERES